MKLVTPLSLEWIAYCPTTPYEEEGTGKMMARDSFSGRESSKGWTRCNYMAFCMRYILRHFRLHPMIGENQQLVTDEPVKFEK